MYGVELMAYPYRPLVLRGNWSGRRDSNSQKLLAWKARHLALVLLPRVWQLKTRNMFSVNLLPKFYMKKGKNSADANQHLVRQGEFESPTP